METQLANALLSTSEPNPALAPPSAGAGGPLPFRPSGRLTLFPVVEALVADGLLSVDSARALRGRLAARDMNRHPLLAVAGAELPDARDRTGTRKLGVEALTQWLAGKASLPYLRIDPLGLDVARITTLFSLAYAQRHNLLPVGVTAATATIATAEPFARDWLPELERVVSRKVSLVVANPAEIERLQQEFYNAARSVKAQVASRAATQPDRLQNLEQLTELGRAGNLSADNQHIISLSDWLMQYAFDSRASDIHLEPRRDQGHVRFRIDGVLHEVYKMPLGVFTAVTARIKVLSRLDLTERRRPQDGRVKTRTPDGREIELRISSLPTAFGEKIVMRIFDPEVLVRSFDAMGFAGQQKATWDRLTHQPHGIVLVTGPTGSGKTTTLYSTLKTIAGPTVNVCTIEDPIELVEPAFNQMQVNSAIDLTFASGIRALLRQDPDIIMVGEIRDLEAAEIAVQAALTGHLVLATLHTNDAPSAVTRLLDLGVPPYLVKATLLGVLAQRLVRRLCPHCKGEAQVSGADWTQFSGLAPPEAQAPVTVYEPVGCDACRGTGYLGRFGLFEMLAVSDPLREIVTGHADLTALRVQAEADGMENLRQAGAQQVLAGQTSIAEVVRVTPAPLPTQSPA